MPNPPFEKSVFINCPFDKDYEPILQAMLFCVVYLGFAPRLATERIDGGENRLEKIIDLIRNSKFSIHDLSRAQANAVGEHARMNMPFELGIDYGCRQFHLDERSGKKILILEEKRYRHQIAISDLAGCDLDVHEADFQKAVRKVRNWLVNEADAEVIGPRKILDAYADFQEWHYERQLAAGFSDDDIQDYPTKELMSSMTEWIAIGKPI
ncbi:MULTISPECIES: hypothetical protein [unclassified Neorhizobium]|uniref:hypothetical protein n=1 Tax=unclassified Neorhizobium TaxID=2629175 RepID=UPI001FF160CB|nr:MULTISPECIES: hypothetical protein [unclassified Neorhizobium]MCJ9671262.1 hypothetical protein [Neorhizobium sp. SHOUNA12B]MCJ9747587.1 hypothetical protein [Neorhizobium sp. SHOUNA12A]